MHTDRDLCRLGCAKAEASQLLGQCSRGRGRKGSENAETTAAPQRHHQPGRKHGVASTACYLSTTLKSLPFLASPQL